MHGSDKFFINDRKKIEMGIWTFVIVCISPYVQNFLKLFKALRQKKLVKRKF